MKAIMTSQRVMWKKIFKKGKEKVGDIYWITQYSTDIPVKIGFGDTYDIIKERLDEIFKSDEDNKTWYDIVCTDRNIATGFWDFTVETKEEINNFNIE